LGAEGLIQTIVGIWHPAMTFFIHRFGKSVEVSATPEGLTIRGPRELSKRENWPADALTTTGA
jgi:hypothetical protein